MITISAEEFKKRYGDVGAKSLTEVPKPKTLAQRIGSDVSAAGTRANAAIAGTGEFSGQSPVRRGVEATAAAFNAIPKVASEALPAPARKALDFVGTKAGEGIDAIASKIGESKKLQQWTETHPDAAKALEEILGTASSAGNIAADIIVADQGTKALQKGVDVTKTLSQNAADSIVQRGTNAFDALAKKTGDIATPFADKVTLSKIEPRVQTILKESTPEQLDSYIKIGEQSIKDPRSLTPLEEAGIKGQEVAKTIKSDLNQVGQQKSDVLKSVEGTRIPGIASRQAQEIKPLLQSKLTDSERALVQEYLDELNLLGDSPTAGSVDSTVDKLQATLFEKSRGVAVPTTPRVKAAINSSIGKINNELKQAVDTAAGNNSYSTLNTKYAQRIRVFNTLNKALGEGGARGGSLMKRFFSPQDAGIKNLFDFIKTTYGVDLGKEATLAKFVMDTLGDTRARSLLQLPPTTPSGIIGKVVDYAERKLTEPARVFKKAKSLIKP